MKDSYPIFMRRKEYINMNLDKLGDNHKEAITYLIKILEKNPDWSIIEVINRSHAFTYNKTNGPKTTGQTAKALRLYYNKK